MLKEMKKENNKTLTKNGATVYASTLNSVLDFYALGGALRNRNEQSIIDLFKKAYIEDNLLALKALFQNRDCREGKGERRTARILFKYLANNFPKNLIPNLDLIPEYGRYDDLLYLLNSDNEDVKGQILWIVKKQFEEDLKSEYPSLLGKWMPTSSTNKRRKELKYLVKNLDVENEKDYRLKLTALRKKINIVETKISTLQYDKIDYSKIPSLAMKRYFPLFFKYDEDRFQKYLDDVNNNKAKMNTSVLEPCDIVKEVLCTRRDESRDNALCTMWNNLPDYVGDNEENVLPVIDVSGSMECGMSTRPIDIAISLGLYLAKRNKGEFANHFITFSSNPKLEEIKGKNIVENIEYISKSNWGYSTNIERVFNLILNTAVNNKLPQNEMPSRIIIISDMEFDAASRYKDNVSLFEVIKEEYESKGYKLPKLVFWNVNSEDDRIPEYEGNVQLVSGCSSRIFKLLLKNETLTALELMLEDLNSERYAKIKLSNDIERYSNYH